MHVPCKLSASGQLTLPLAGSLANAIGHWQLATFVAIAALLDEPRKFDERAAGKLRQTKQMPSSHEVKGMTEQSIHPKVLQEQPHHWERRGDVMAGQD